MSNISGIAGDALKAFSISQQITSNNVANVSTDGFSASQAIFQEKIPSGVTAIALSTYDSVDISLEATNLLTKDVFTVAL
jgi:flagellar basal body rod protein FlgB